MLDRSTNPDSFSAYVDGTAIAVTVTYNGINDLNIGSDSITLGGLEYFAGAPYRNTPMDEVRTYNRLLTASEIKQLANIGAVKVAKTSTPTGSLQTGLMGHWTFDGKDTNWGTNKVTNLGSIGGTGTLTNMSTSTSPTAGKIGQGFNFDDTNDSINLNSTVLDPGTGDFTVSFWYKNAKAGNIIHGKGDNTFQAAWEITTSRVMFTTVSLGGTFLTANYTSSLVNNDGSWHHFVAILDRSTTNDSVSIYVDGAPFGFTYSAQNLNGENLSGVNNVYIGPATYVGMTNDYYGGGLDDVRIYNRVLSATEAKQLYNLGR